MEHLILYGIELSPPIRAVLLTLNALQLAYEFKEVNLLNGEHRTEEFESMNPQHTVPLLDDGGHYIWDSHAINAYLVSKYGKTDDLYPKDLLKRAVVDQRLHFDSGILFPNFRSATDPLLFMNVTDIPKEKIDAIYKGMDFLELFLTHDYIAGETLTIADFSIVTTIKNYDAYAPLDPARTPKLADWVERMAKLPYYEKANAKGAATFAEVIKGRLTSK